MGVVFYYIMAALFVYSAVEANKAKRAARKNKGRGGVDYTAPSTENSINIVLGEVQRLAGTIAYRATNDVDFRKNDLLHLIIVWGESVESIDQLYIDDEPITSSKFRKINYHWAQCVHFPNGMNGYADPLLVKSGFDPARYKFEGLACSYVRLEWVASDPKFSSSPNITADITGKKILDIRDGSYSASTNPILQAYYYLHTSKSGKQIPNSEIDLDSVKRAATACDLLVYKDTTQTAMQPLFTSNTVLDTSKEIKENIETLLLAARCSLPKVNGKYTFIVDDDYAQVDYHLDDDTIIGQVEFNDSNKSDRFNQVIIEFFDKKTNGKINSRTFPVVGSQVDLDWLAEDDGHRLSKTIKIETLNDEHEALRLAEFIARVSRNQLQVSLVAKPSATLLVVGDIVPLTRPLKSINRKPFKIINKSDSANGEVQLELIEHQPINYQWLPDRPAQEAPDTDLQRPEPSSPSNLAVTVKDDGKALFEWDSTFKQFDFAINQNGKNVLAQTLYSNSFNVHQLNVGDYEVDVRAVSVAGRKSQWATLSFEMTAPIQPTISLDSAAYNALTLSAHAGFGIAITFEWQFLGLAESPAQSGPSVTGYTYTRQGLQPEKAYAFRCRTINPAGISPWKTAIFATSLSDVLDHIENMPLTKLSDDAQSLIADMNAQVDRLRPETENNLPSLIAKNLNAITGLSTKIEVLDAENPHGIPFKIDQLVDIVDVINAENPNNLQQQLADSNSKIGDLERVTEVLNESNQNSLPALIKINNIAIEQQRLEQQNLGLSLLNVTSAYTNWRTEYERRAFNNERLIDAAVYVEPDTGTIVNRAFAYADESFKSATLLIDGVNSKITLASQQITQSQNRISQAEAQLIVQAAQINQKATFAEVEGQIAGALAALQPAYSWQFNTSTEGFDPDSHNATGYIVATTQISSPVISYNANENPMFRLRVRKHNGAIWRGDIKFNGGVTTLHLTEPTGTDFETLTLDATGTEGYTGTITSLEFDLGPCDIDFIEVGKRGANDLALADITARTTELEQDINAATGIMAQYATTSWVNALGYQTQSNVQTLIDSFNTQYSIAATLQEFNEQDIIVKANAAQTWIDGANATIRDQVTSILNSEDGVNQRISVAEQNIDAIAGEISQSITQVSGLEFDVKGLGLNEVIAAYNQMQQDQELAEQSFSLATANQKLTAVTDDVKSLATQTLELVGLYGQNAAYLTSLNSAFANERTARSTAERELRAEITREGTRSVAQANERVDAIVGYCVDARGNKVDEPDAIACIAAGHDWVDGPLVQLINDYTAVFVNNKGYQTATNVQQFISTFDGEYSITATIQQINEEGIITAAKEAQQWINAAEGTITNVITQFVDKPNGINDNLAFAYNLIQANADDISSEATAREQLSARVGVNEADVTTLNSVLTTEQQARASMGSQLRIEFQTQDLAMLATANEYTRATSGYCVNANGDIVDQEDAVACEAAGHTWVNLPSVTKAVELSSAYVDEKGYQNQNNVSQLIDTFNSTYSITATIQQINEEGIITAAKKAQQWINAAEGTITNVITQFVDKPNGINDNLAFAYDLIQANADDISSEATARQQLSARVGVNEADVTTLNSVLTTEQQARASMGTQLRIEFQSQDLAMLATANEFTRAVTGYCVDENGERVDQDDAVQCELDGHTWIDGPAVQRAVEIGAAWVTLQGYQTQSNVSQLLDTFNSTYQISATLQEFAKNGTLQKANNAQQFINAAEGYIENQITLFNDKEGGVNATFANVKQRLDAAEGAVTTSILQIQGLELGQQAQGLNDVIAAYNQFKQDQDLATLNVKASLANEKLQAQTTDIESLAQQQLELAAIFNSKNAIITSLNKAISNQYQASVVRDQRYQATFDNVTARFSDVTTAIATIDEANTLRDVEFESFVADTIASFDEVSETFASQNQAFSTLQQTLTSKINEDTEAAKNTAIATAQEYTRTAVGHCVNAEGQITSENDAVQCIADGGSWVSGPLAEFIANMQITDGENSASIKQLRQLFTTVDGKLVARGGWTLDNNGRVTGIAGYNDGEIGNLDLIGDVIRQGIMVDDLFVPTSYVDNTNPLKPEHVFKGRLVLGDGHEVKSLDDIKAQDGKDGNDGAEGPQGVPGINGENGKTTYTWIKYADNASGAGLSNSPINKVFIGFAYNKLSAIESNNAADYIWSKIKGEDGANGIDGTDGVPGAKGADGQTTYTWIAYSNNADGSGMYQVPNSNTKYIGIAVNKTSATESGNPADYTWSLFKGADGQNGTDGADGATGPQGIPGVKGADGVTTYTWLKYADSVSGAGLSNSPTNKEFIGFAYNKTTATESNNPADYTWSKIKGEDGANGIDGTDGVPGAKGADGQTTYTWIAYSDNANGANLYQTPTVNTQYIGIAVNKTSAAESTNQADYTWSLFKGADGKNGGDGANGERGAGRYTVATGAGIWADITANAATAGGVPVENDIVTIYKSTDPKVQTTKRFTGSHWQNYTLHIHGSALIEDTLDAKVIRAESEISSPVIKGGRLESTTGTFTGDLSAAGGTFKGDLSAAGGTFAGNLSAVGGTFKGNLSAAGGTFKGTVYANNIEGDVTDLKIKPTLSASVNSTGQIETVVSFTVSRLPFARSIVLSGISIQGQNQHGGGSYTIETQLYFTDSASPQDQHQHIFSGTDNRAVMTRSLAAIIPANSSKTVVLALKKISGSGGTVAYAPVQKVICQTFKDGTTIS